MSSYTQEVLEHAIGLVKSGSMSLNGASKAFNIPFSTLGDKVRGRRPVKAQPKSLLTSEEEERLVSWICLYAERSMGRSHEDLRNKVDMLDLRGAVGRRDDGRPGKDWVLSFKKRHPEISLHTPQSLGKERALVSQHDVSTWLGNMRKYLDIKDPDLLQSADRIFNADETGFSLCSNSKKILGPTGIKHNITNNTRQQLTVLCCASAAGEFVSPLIIYPRKRLPPHNLLDGFEGAFLQISPTGWINSTIFHTWINNIFIPFVANKKKPVVLFIDGHTSHNSDIQTLDLCDNHGIILYGLLPYSSHIIQPLDLTVFGSMKATWPTVVQRHFEETGETASPTNFSKLLKSVWDICAKPEASLKGFMRAGIFPFNPDNPLSSGKLEVAKSFTSSPPSTDASPSTSHTHVASTSSHYSPTSPPIVPSPSISTSALTPVSPTLDQISALLDFSHEIGQEKSNYFMRMIISNNNQSNDVDFIHFKYAISALGACTNPTPAPQSLDTILVLAPPSLQRNKSCKAPQTNFSLNTAYSSEEYQGYLKRKEDSGESYKRKRKKRKVEREKLYDDRLKEKKKAGKDETGTRKEKGGT